MNPFASFARTVILQRLRNVPGESLKHILFADFLWLRIDILTSTEHLSRNFLIRISETRNHIQHIQ